MAQYWALRSIPRALGNATGDYDGSPARNCTSSPPMRQADPSTDTSPQRAPHAKCESLAVFVVLGDTRCMDTTFAELGLNEHILAGVETLGFTTPTPVQADAIPLILEGRDVVASAQTGTGKTCAFALPVLQRIAPSSRAARENLVEQASDDDLGGDTGVLADSVPEETLSVSTPPDSDAPKPRRRRRRYHRRAGSVKPAAPKAKPTEEAQQPQKNEEPTPKPKRKRRRRRKRKRTAEDTQRSAHGTNKPKQPAFGPFALVITPTRELAQQIDNVVSVICEHTGQRAVIVMGGAKFNKQIRALEAGCDMLVATPGRLIDLVEHKHVDLTHVEVLVLDEADRMLDMGFWPSVRRIMSELPQERQNLLFSATIPPSIKSTIDAMLKDPAYVEISQVGQTAETVEEHLCPITQGQKTQLLHELIRSGGAQAPASPERVLVFCRTKQRVDDVSRSLKQAGFSVDVMHSDRPQKARERALAKFRVAKCQVLVATDVMSRGIDVSGIDAVVNYDVPLDPEDYVHRIGRTGRAGATGHAYTFVAPDEITPLREIEYFTAKLIPTWDLPDFSYDAGRIIPNASRSTTKPMRTMFSGMKARGRGMASGRYGRHY